MGVKQIMKELKKNSKCTKKNLEGMARFGINVDKVLCVPIPFVKKLAKKIGKDHKLALELWKTEYTETRMLAAFIDDPLKVTEKQMDKWAKDFNCWTICDQTCSYLFDRTSFYIKKIFEYVKSKKEFVKRAGFVMMATSAVHDKKANDKQFLRYLPTIVKYADDERNFVKKGINWALRNIGKRNLTLNKAAIKAGEDILKKHSDSKAARWIARDAIRELKEKAKIMKN
ncbi:DNA alkylation repair protein [Nanoarchaeota archaeon]